MDKAERVGHFLLGGERIRNVLDKTKRLVWLLLLWPSFSWAYSGTCGIWAQKRGDFVSRNFAGTQAGYAAAVAYVGTNGSVFVYGGCEGLISLGTLSDSVTVYTYGNGSWNVAGNRATAIIPRLGPQSSPTSGGAIRIVDGVTFGRTRAGIQAAINESYDAGGGIVWFPSGGTVSIDSTLLLRNRVQLVGPGTHSTPTLLKAADGVSLRSLAENADTTGSQQYVGISGLAFDGNSSGGASVAYGIRYKDVFIGSYIRDTRVANCSGQGLRLESDASGLGPIFVENFLSNDNGGDGVCLTGQAMTSVWLTGLDIERWGTGCAGLRFNGSATGSSSFGAVADGVYMEAANDATADGVVIGNMHNVSVNNVNFNPTNSINYPVKIEGAATTGPFSAWGARITNVRASNDTILFDQVNNHAITGSGGSISVIPEYIVANGAQSYRRESLVLQDSLRVVGRTMLTDTLRVQGRVDLNNAMLFRKGADITAASSIAIGTGNAFSVSGATTITDITGPSTGGKQQLVTFFFSNTGVTITDTNHWQLNGDFVDDGVNGVDTLTGLWGGTNFIEVGRSHN